MNFPTLSPSLLASSATGALVALLVAAAWIDWRTMRIPNWLTVSGMGLGLAGSAASAEAVLQGLLAGLGGLAVGLLLFLPLWLIRVMGAGDVKLMAMVGAFLGAWATVKAALVVGIVGGLAAVLFALTHRAAGRLADNMREVACSLALPGVPLWRPGPDANSIGNLPYGVSICLGTLAYLGLRLWGIA